MQKKYSEINKMFLILIYVIYNNNIYMDLIRRFNDHIDGYEKKKYSYTIENMILKLYNIINLVKVFKEMIENYDDEIDFKMLKSINYDELQYDIFTLLNILQHNLFHEKHTPRRQRKKNFIKLKYFYFSEQELKEMKEEFTEFKQEFKEEFKEQLKEELQEIKENMQQKFENKHFEKKQEIKKEIKIDKNNINSIKISSSDDKELFLYI